MKRIKGGLSFQSKGAGINCFYADIFRFGKQRNVLFFLKQFFSGLKLEWKNK